MRDEVLNEKGVGASWEQRAAMQAQPLRGSESGQPKQTGLGLPAAGMRELRAVWVGGSRKDFRELEL